MQQSLLALCLQQYYNIIYSSRCRLLSWYLAKKQSTWRFANNRIYDSESGFDINIYQRVQIQVCWFFNTCTSLHQWMCYTINHIPYRIITEVRYNYPRMCLCKIMRVYTILPGHMLQKLYKQMPLLTLYNKR